MELLQYKTPRLSSHWYHVSFLLNFDHKIVMIWIWIWIGMYHKTRKYPPCGEISGVNALPSEIYPNMIKDVMLRQVRLIIFYTSKNFLITCIIVWSIAFKHFIWMFSIFWNLRTILKILKDVVWTKFALNRQTCQGNIYTDVT